MSAENKTGRRPKAVLASGRVWHSTWGQEKELVGQLSRRMDVDVLDLVDFGGRHAKAGLNRYPPPPGVRVIERLTPPTLPLQGLYLELANGLRLLFGDYDLFITYPTAGSVLATVAARLRGAKVMLIYGDDYAAFYRAKSRLAGWLTARIANPLVARLAHAAVATAELLAEDIRPFNPGVVVIPNGADASRLASVPAKAGGRFTVGFVGGFGHWVDFEAVVEAARLLPEVDFRLVGGGDRYDEVAALAAKLDNVELTGQVGYERVLAELADMDTCLIPFKVSPLTDRVSPIKLFEYWAAGRPVIASPAREIRRTAGSEAALYYRDGDGADLARVIDRLRSENGLAAGLTEAGRKRLKDYDWTEIIKRYWKLLAEIGLETGDD